MHNANRCDEEEQINDCSDDENCSCGDSVAWLYLMGAGLFVLGSIFFFPALSELFQAGNALFLVGCVCYVVGAILEYRSLLARRLADDRGVPPSVTERASAAFVFLGASIFWMGCVFFLPNTGFSSVSAGTWCFIAGSIGFGVAAFLSLPAGGFGACASALGSACYAIASIPYLLSEASISLFVWSGALFLVGSLLFFLAAGLVLLRRAPLEEPEATGGGNEG